MKSQSVKDARKVKYTQDQVKAIILAFEQYIEETEFPNLSGFIIKPEIRHKFKLSPQYVYNHPEYFEYLLSVSKAKCENHLLKMALAGRAMPAAIFGLKQGQYGGYSDSQQIDLKSNIQPIKFVNTVPRPKRVTDKKSKTE